MVGSRGDDAAALDAWVARARGGDRDALDAVVRALQHDVYRLALRMTGCPDDAADATQEILVKVATHLGGFRGEASVRTWAYRIGVRHLLDRKKSRVERLTSSFERFGADLIDGLADPDPDPRMAEEVKLGCTLAMLTCLDREHRLAYVLADVFDAEPALAASLCDVSPEAYRQRVSRARRALQAFVESFCGLVRDGAPCGCDRRVARAVELGRIHRDDPRLLREGGQAERLPRAHREMRGLFDAASLVRSHPEYPAPERIARAIGDALAGARLLTDG